MAMFVRKNARQAKLASAAGRQLRLGGTAAYVSLAWLAGCCQTPPRPPTNDTGAGGVLVLGLPPTSAILACSIPSSWAWWTILADVAPCPTQSLVFPHPQPRKTQLDPTIDHEPIPSAPDPD